MLRARNKDMLRKDMAEMCGRGWKNEGTITYGLLSREGSGEVHVSDEREGECHPECGGKLWEEL